MLKLADKYALLDLKSHVEGLLADGINVELTTMLLEAAALDGQGK